MQNKPDYLDQLIKKASEKAGSDYKLAQRLNVSRGNVSDWKTGRRSCPAADQALMASIAGLDPEAWAARAIISQHEGSEKGELLKQALKKALVATGAVLGTFGSQAQADSLTVMGYLIRCINRQRQSVIDFRLSKLTAGT
jgi:DNA-binding transcriptional regulator YdaS (Cro superfamily)